MQCEISAVRSNTNFMKSRKLLIISLVAIAQWGVVCALAGFKENGFSNGVYYIGFGAFWIGLATIIWLQFYKHFTKPK